MTAGGALAAPGDAGKLPATTVKAAQRALAVKADGVVGPKTKRAIRRYQRSRGLDADGVLGPATLKALGVSTSAGDDESAANAPPQAGANTDASTGGGAQAGAGSGAGEPTTTAASDTPDAPTADQQATLDRIAECESGGDPTAISPTGQYRGKYQFDRQTWVRMGGTGDPAAAPEAEQDARAAKLLAAAGTSPWPVCG